MCIERLISGTEIIVSAFSTFFEKITETISSISDFIKNVENFFKTMFDGITYTFNSVKDGCEAFFANGFAKIKVNGPVINLNFFNTTNHITYTCNVDKHNQSEVTHHIQEGIQVIQS